MSNETKQTAVEWLYIEMGKFLYGKSEFRDANDILTKAKEMEKEQMIDAFTMSDNKQQTAEQTHTCVFEKSKTSNSNEAKCKYCNIVRYTIDVKLDHNETYGGNK